jgi:hypothetical protein
MENLNDLLKSIQKSGKTIAEKKQMCIELGLRKRDIEYLEFTGFFDGKSLTFGVEIECFVNAIAMRNAARENNLEINYEGYNHRDNDHYYKFVSDSSVRGLPDPIECVSPILKDSADGHESLKTACKALNEAGARVNSTCGLHVHVGVEEYTETEYINIFKNYQRLEELIDSFMAPSRRGECSWAHSIRRFNYNYCLTKENVLSLMGGRYFKVNPESYRRHKTVEFRQHQGTTNHKKISMWVNFCLKLVSWSKENVLDRYIHEIAEIPFLDEEEKRYFTARQREVQWA